jgi:hypothetical protein
VDNLFIIIIAGDIMITGYTLSQHGIKYSAPCYKGKGHTGKVVVLAIGKS